MPVIGWVDHISEEKISGWVHDSEYPSRSEQVEVVINGTPTVQILAQKDRKDLREKKISFTQKGFNLTLNDFTEKAANVVEFFHAESGSRIGLERYHVFSTKREHWSRAQEAEIQLVRNLFSEDRKFYKDPTAGSWNHVPDFEALLPILIKNSRYLPAAVSLLQIEAPSTSLANAFKKANRLGRLGIVESSQHLADWHASNSADFAQVDIYNNINEAGRSWDVVLAPMLHERSGPSFKDILKYCAAALHDRGLVVFDIREDTSVGAPYLLAHGERLLRISTVEEAKEEAASAGFKVLETAEFFYVPGDPETKRTMLAAVRNAEARK